MTYAEPIETITTTRVKSCPQNAELTPILPILHPPHPRPLPFKSIPGSVVHLNIAHIRQRWPRHIFRTSLYTGCRSWWLVCIPVCQRTLCCSRHAYSSIGICLWIYEIRPGYISAVGMVLIDATNSCLSAHRCRFHMVNTARTS